MPTKSCEDQSGERSLAKGALVVVLVLVLSASYDGRCPLLTLQAVRELEDMY